jgi:ABC-type glycerol-3-phosphate transport system permease component
MKIFKNSRFSRSTGGNIVSLFFLIVFGAFSVLPMFYCLITSLKPLDELLIFPPHFYVTRPTFNNYFNLSTLLSNLNVPLSRYIFNSIFITLSGTVLSIIISTGAAFVLSKIDLKFKEGIFTLVQWALLYNGITLAVPRYLIESKLHMIDTYWVYIIPYCAGTMGVFLIKQYMDKSVPDAMIEAASIDGAGYFRTFFQIAVQLVRPAWLTLALFAFRDLWSVDPVGTIFSENLKTLTSAASSIASGGIARSGSAMAITVVMMIPPILVFLISQNSITETMSTSGIK